jgi:hypothetical protein
MKPAPGDLCLLVGVALRENIGKFVTAVRPYTGALDDNGAPVEERSWEVSPAILSSYVTVDRDGRREVIRIATCVVPEKHLKPIRPGDGQDEVLRIAGLPAQPLERA